MNESIHKESFRVTSVPFFSSRQAIFTGIPLVKDSYRRASGKYIVSVKIDANKLPVPPAVGQHWKIEGKRAFKKVDCGTYQMSQHLYKNPDSFECSLPETGEQFIRFIAKESDFKGIGESKARALWDHVGSEIHSILSNDTQENRTRLQCVLNEDAIEALFVGYKKYSNLKHCNWMSKIGIPAQVQQRILKHHGEKTVEQISENPYILSGFGTKFQLIDDIASSHFKISKVDPRRLSAAVEFSIANEVSKGHTYTTPSELKPHLTKILSGTDLISRALDVAAQKTQYLYNKRLKTFHPTAQLLMETVVAKRLLKMNAKKNLFDNDCTQAFQTAISELPYTLLEKQRLAVITCLDNTVSCITGGAGTGKTTVLRTALRAFDLIGYEIHAVALSGIAAMRLQESIQYITMTIAKFLREGALEPSEKKRAHLLVIDESSMLDIPTMYRIVNNLHPSVRIIFAGDPNQLPPIGCGKVLADVVDSDIIPNTTLDIVQRQEGLSGIPEYAKSINEGVVPKSLSTHGIHFHECERDKVPLLCADLFAQTPESSQIVGATKKIVEECNRTVQSDINPDGKQMQFKVNGDMFTRDDLREGDQVLFTTNHYEAGVQNGSLGKLTSVVNEGDSFGSVHLDTKRSIDVTQTLMECMELGYSITLHKGQGSQWERIIIALPEGRSSIIDRAWLYTAVTRAEKEVHIVGSSKKFKEVVETPSIAHKRNSYLFELLQQDKS